MGTRRPNPRLVKIHRNYTAEEAARCLGIHKNTIREWVKRGLPANDGKRPLLILGCELRAYLQARRVKRKQPCKENELYCLRCRTPKVPAGGMVDYQPITLTLGNLIAMCSDCYTIMYRRTSLVKLDVLGRHMNITIQKASPRIVDITEPKLNRDFTT